MPLSAIPLLKYVPLRIEYIMRINAAKPSQPRRRVDRDKTVFFSTGLDTIDLSLDELNFCLEWDEHSPVWVLHSAAA